MKNITSILALIISLVTLTACTSGGGGTSATTADASGVWLITDTSGSNTCGDPVGVVNTYTLTITQSGTTLTVSDGTNIYTGSISGHTISWSGSYPESGGTVTITNLSLTLSQDELSVSGTVSWSWSDGFGFTCTGSSNISGINTSGTATDDQYEENDDILNATPTFENTVYTAVQLDEDWYQIDVTPGYERVVVNLGFTNADGDIDLELYDSFGNFVYGSYSTTDNEQIDYTVSAGGTYYLRVFYADAGNTYTLSWDDLQPVLADDIYEPNNTLGTATPTLENILYSGIQHDDDWYKIDVTPGFQNVVATLTFSNAAGDLDLELYDSSGLYVTGVYSTTDNESLNIIVGTSGTYYLKVISYPTGTDTGNSYTLIWDDL